MTSLNTPAADKGVLSHGEPYMDIGVRAHYEQMRQEKRQWEVEAAAIAAKPDMPCVWKFPDTCRECELIRKCFPLEAKS